MEIAKDLLYTESHEWVRKEDEKTVTIGITDFAQESLGDITFVELPAEGSSLEKGDAFGVVESVKAVSDLVAPISGLVKDSNRPVVETPEMLNEDPYNEGWMLKVEISSPIEGLMDADAYKAFVEDNA